LFHKESPLLRLDCRFARSTISDSPLFSVCPGALCLTIACHMLTVKGVVPLKTDEFLNVCKVSKEMSPDDFGKAFVLAIHQLISEGM